MKALTPNWCEGRTTAGMKAALLIILLSSIVLLHAGTDVPVYPDFDLQRLAGRWYPIAVAYRNMEPKSLIPFDGVVEPSGEGDLVLKLRYVLDGKCLETEVDVRHTKQPGVFKVPATSEAVRVVDIDYESYNVVHVENDRHSSILNLSSRTREASDEVKTKFTTFAKTLGFDMNQIRYKTLAGKSEFGGMFEECTASIISIMVLQMTLTATCHVF